MYKQDLALNNQERVICHKIQPTNYKKYKYSWVIMTREGVLAVQLEKMVQELSCNILVLWIQPV